jgi:hypothetical protein
MPVIQQAPQRASPDKEPHEAALLVPELRELFANEKKQNEIEQSNASDAHESASGAANDTWRALLEWSPVKRSATYI